MTAPPTIAALKAAERACPHWHLFLSSEGRVWAVTTRCAEFGCGTTLDAGSVKGIRDAIARTEADWRARGLRFAEAAA